MDLTLLIESFYSSILSTFNWLYIVILGILAKRFKFLDDNFESSLSKLVANIVLPSFIFTQIVNNFRISDISLIIESLIGLTCIFIVGIFLGFISGKILRLTKSQTNFIIAIFSTPDNTSIYVILIQVIGSYLNQILPPYPYLLGDCSKRGLLYAIINSIYLNIWKWSGAYYLIDEKDEEEENNKEKGEYALGLEGDVNEPLIDSVGNINFSVKRKIENKKKDEGFKSILAGIINMPLITSIITLFITFFPSLQAKFITPKLFLRETFTKVNTTISHSYSFMLIFMLGLSVADFLYQYKKINKINKNEYENMPNFDEDKDKEDEGISGKESFLTVNRMIWLILTKFVFMPIISTPIIFYVCRGWLHSDDVLVFNYLFLSTSPCSLNMIVICIYKGSYVKEMSTIMICLYTVAIICLTLNITCFIYILGSINASVVSPNLTAPI